MGNSKNLADYKPQDTSKVIKIMLPSKYYAPILRRPSDGFMLLFRVTDPDIQESEIGYIRRDGRNKIYYL